MELDFCKLEVSVLHSLQSYTTVADQFHNLKAISYYYKEMGTRLGTYNDPNFVVLLEFTNEMIDCELNIVDSTLTDGSKFSFVVYNITSEIIFSVGDYLIFKYYWKSDPSKYTIYHGCIKTVKNQRCISEIKATIEGELVHQNLLYNWTIYNKYPTLSTYSQIPDFIINELQLKFYSTMSGWDSTVKIPEIIFTKGKSVGKILDTVCAQVTKNKGNKDPISWKLINESIILILRKSDLANEELNRQYKITVPSIQYSDLFTFFNNSKNYEIEVTGIPTLRSGVVFYIDMTGVPKFVTEESAYYVADEIEHTITCTDGYTTKIYATKIVK